MKHHFSPQFYLSGWTTNGQLCCMRKIYGRIVVDTKTPAGTGYVHDGYKTDHIPEADAHRVETAFMSPLDNGAARELQRMLASDPRIRSSEERSAWTRFVISLLFRHPAAVETLKAHFGEMHGLAVEGAQAENPGTVITLDPAYTSIAASNMLTDIIDNTRVGPTIFDMKWVVVDVTASKIPLMTSDRPVVMPLGLADPDCHIALPISPAKLFIAAHTDRFKQLKPGRETVVVKAINKAVVVQAREFVWGVDDSQLAFVEKHMGTAGERPLMDAQGKQAAMDAARGIKPAA
ncbi:DUF4238 domain-containing protein [Bradyrhizobium oligotrophicum]|uniref:DUF4238 domain-containing protein n=1 Tax=Bradyrhizobium oligotrophicum TaxID=44255 RepID=UPI003EBDED53